MAKTNNFQIKSKDTGGVGGFETLKIDGKLESTALMPTKTDGSKVMSENEYKEFEDNSDSEFMEMPAGDQNLIISEIKVEETQLGNDNISENIRKVEFKTRGRRRITNFKCPSCDHVAKNSNRLYYHRITRHATEKDHKKCQFCSYKHTLKHKIFDHIKSKHKQLIKSLKAEAESKKASSTTNEDASTSSVSKEIPKRDGEEFSTSNSENQLQQNSEVSSNNDFIRKLLNISTNRRNKIFPFSCDKCGKVYSRPAYLYEHKKTHLIEKKKCSICSYEASQHQLKIHFRICHTERPFQCGICLKSFAARRSLKRHINTHADSTLKCDICAKTFACSRYLNLHKSRHVKQEQKCECCGKLIKDMARHKQKCFGRNKNSETADENQH